MLNELAALFSDVAALYTDNLALFAGSVFLLGLIVGSFLNVVIYRLPIMMQRDWRAQAAEEMQLAAGMDALPAPPSVVPERFNLTTPRSACPACKSSIKAWQNIPVVSWLVLRGRCASCSTRISARYPLVELATGLLSAWVAWHFGFGAPAACGLLLTWSLIALTGIDMDHQLLPDDITVPLVWGGLLAAVFVGPIAGSSIPVSAHDAIIGAACGYLSLWLIFHAYRLLTGKIGMGHGDFKLFGAVGAWLGWKLLPLIILLSAGTGAVLGVSMILLRGRDKSVPLSFGPYLAAAGWLAMMYGNAMVDAYLRISGLKH